MTKVLLEKEFRNRFHKEPSHVFFCPGRVNLIGEHIDYNGGKVLPCAITLGTYLAISKNTDRLFRMQCLNFPETAELHFQSSYSKTGKEWFNYPLGVINEFVNEQVPLSGLDMLFYGNLPIGAGLSSSASIEVLTAFALNELFDAGLSKPAMATMSKKVENEFIGLNCGIMDQFAVAMGKTDNAILLNCDTLEYEYIPFNIGNYVLAIINSKKQRSLAESKYNERFAECGASLKLLKRELEVSNLCDITPGELESHIHLIDDAVLQKRSRHVVMENDRVKRSKDALQAGDIKLFGELMYASHESLQHLYEVSGRELDTIVEFAKAFDGCIGARMTGAGFGGCAIALVNKDRFQDFVTQLTAYYQQKIGYEPEVFASEIGEGVRDVKC